jgi:glycosyltransferase involved in cell wall biosynthesis
MRICFFGTYTVSEGYPVNRFLINGLREYGTEVEECREDLWEGFLHVAFRQAKGKRLVRLAWRGVRCYARLLWRYWKIGDHECVIVGYPGYFDIFLARLLNLFGRRQVVLVAFISLYDTIVVDRGQLAIGSWKAKALKWIDRMAFARADLVLVDTRQQGDYYADLLGLPRDRFERSFVGHEFDRFETDEGSGKGASGKFEVLFFGTYVPLHGIDVILDAAELLRTEADIVFTLIGNGQLYPQMREQARVRNLTHIRFIDTWMEAEGLAERVHQADVCLGIFGRTEKAARVIPYKVFGALALQKPVVTRESPAVLELLADGESALLCREGTGRELADAILKLRDRPEEAAHLARQGYAAYREHASPRAVGSSLLEILEKRSGG